VSLPQLGPGGVHHVLRHGVAVADRNVQIVSSGELQRLQGLLQHFFRAVDTGLTERLGELGLSRGTGLLTLFLMDEPADTRARLSGDNETLPLR